MKTGRYIIYWIVWLISVSVWAQNTEVQEVAQTKEEFIRENHVEDIENVVHQFTTSKKFLNFLLEQGHDINPESVVIKRKDISVGEDIDIYVKHFSAHQNFTMLMVPVNVYSLAIYDTLLFSVIEVSEQWLADRFYNNDLEDDSVVSHLLSIENHRLLSRHMYEQAMKGRPDDITEIEISLHESYVSSSSIHLHVSDLSDEEKKEFRRTWGLMKKVFSHDVNLNIEMNVYIFGYDDMNVIYHTKSDKKIYKVTPNNIFTRHHFIEG